MTSRFLAVLLSLAVCSSVSGTRPQAPSDQFVLRDDLEIALWAESPLFFNPTNIDVDARGRIWVAEAVNYRALNTAKQDALTHQAGDRIVILSDTTAMGGQTSPRYSCRTRISERRLAWP